VKGFFAAMIFMMKRKKGLGELRSGVGNTLLGAMLKILICSRISRNGRNSLCIRQVWLFN
jgi:hypothetical protein